MKRTVWASLMYTSTIYTLGKQWFKSSEALYQYQAVPIPLLFMVDDVICVSNKERSREINNLVNRFIESKKLGLSEKKCFQIHMGKGH